MTIGDQCYLFDAGAPVAEALTQLRIPFSAVRGIFISHLHGDHLDGLIHLVDLMCWYYRDCSPVIYLPGQSGINAMKCWLDMLEVSCERVSNFVDISGGMLYQDDNITVTAVRNRHLTGEKRSYGFLIEAEGKHVFFTGDMGSGFDDYMALFEKETFDLVFCEAAHGLLTEKAENLCRIQTKQLCLYHIYSDFNTAKVIAQFRERMPYPVVTGYDEMEIVL